MGAKPADDENLRDEWQRAQGMGRRLGRQRAIATIAGVVCASLGLVASVLVYVVWPFARVPMWILALPFAISLALGGYVQHRLRPKGQFDP